MDQQDPPTDCGAGAGSGVWLGLELRDSVSPTPPPPGLEPAGATHIPHGAPARPSEDSPRDLPFRLVHRAPPRASSRAPQLPSEGGGQLLDHRACPFACRLAWEVLETFGPGLLLPLCPYDLQQLQHALRGQVPLYEMRSWWWQEHSIQLCSCALCKCTWWRWERQRQPGFCLSG